jgi:hypothetical protein
LVQPNGHPLKRIMQMAESEEDLEVTTCEASLARSSRAKAPASSVATGILSRQ